MADQQFALFRRKHAKLYNYAELKKDFVKAPTSAEEWEGICREFYQRWNFPHCLGIFKANWSPGSHDNTCLFLLSTGAIDGKHIVVQAPINSGLLYYNYKGTHSVVLLAVCDAQYTNILFLPSSKRFILIDLGQVGRFSDSEVLAHSAFGRALENGSLHFPVPKSLSGSSGQHLPFVIVGADVLLKMHSTY